LKATYKLYVNIEVSEQTYWWYSVTVTAKCNTVTHTHTLTRPSKLSDVAKSE